MKKNHVLIWGLAKSGLSAVKLALKKGYQVSAVDQKIEAYEQLAGLIAKEDFYLQDDPRLQTLSVDNVVLSPGVPRELSFLNQFVEKNCVISEIEFAGKFLNAPVIAVSGSNGKSTSVTMIHEALLLAGKSSFLCGNIGTPLSEYVLSEKKCDFIVLELSSFQLESTFKLEFLVAAITNIVENHMERYSSARDYALAKLSMFKRAQYCIMREIDFKTWKNELSENISFYQPDTHFDYSKVRVVGEHNRWNFAICLAVISKILDQKVVEKSFQQLINQFAGITHRVEFIREINGVRYFNDSKSTNILSCVTALKCFPAQPVHLILGGKIRSDDLSAMSELQAFPQIKKIYLIGNYTDKISKALKNNFEKSETLQKAISSIYQVAKNGEICLFSPAFPSYDQFKNFEHRGECFREIVLGLDHE